MDPFTVLFNVANYVFNSTAYVAQAIRFVGSVLIMSALSASKQPKLSDLKIQTSAYGVPIPRLYGQAVRVAGNVIDKSDLIPVKHKKGEMLGVGGVKYYTYDAHVAVLIAEGEYPVNGLRRIFADGKCIFDRDAEDALPGVPTAEGGLIWERYLNKTHSKFDTVTYYPGSATQGVDPLLQSLHPGETLSGYRHCAYVVIDRVKCSDFGNRVPNLEFEMETEVTRLGDIVEDLASYAEADVDGSRLDQTVRGFVVATDGSVWSAMEPLANVFFFDLVTKGAGFEAMPRGRYMRTIIPQGKWAARPVNDGAKQTKDARVENPNTYPDELALTYFDPERDYQPGTQRAYRGAGYARNKVNTEVPIVLTADEAIDVAQRAMQEGLVQTKTMQISISAEYRWLFAADVVGLEINGQVEPFRLGTLTYSPNGTIATEAMYEDPYLVVGGLTGATAPVPSNPVLLPGDTIMQAMDTAAIRTVDANDTGIYFAFAGTGNAWMGVELYRAPGTGSPLTYEIVGNAGIGAVIADCDTTLAAGPTDVWDEANTLTVTVVNDEVLTSASASDVVERNANLAWIGGADGQDGEIINFRTATLGSPAGTYVLSGLLRGRLGTEAAVSSHGSGERFVLLTERDALYRVDYGPADWNAARTYKPISINADDATPEVLTNTGRSTRPLAPVHLTGTRNGTNDDVEIAWVRRTRFQTPAIGGGVVPLGEQTEAYEVDVYLAASPAVVARTLTATTPTVTYTAAMLAADGYSPGDLIACTVYQMSGVFGRGEGAEGLV